MCVCVWLQDKISNKHFGLVNTSVEERLLVSALIIFGRVAYVPRAEAALDYHRNQRRWRESH